MYVAWRDRRDAPALPGRAVKLFFAPRPFCRFLIPRTFVFFFCYRPRKQLVTLAMLWVSVMYCKFCFFYGVLQLELTRNVIITVYGVVNLFNLFYFRCFVLRTSMRLLN